MASGQMALNTLQTNRDVAAQQITANNMTIMSNYMQAAAKIENDRIVGENDATFKMQDAISTIEQQKLTSEANKQNFILATIKDNAQSQLQIRKNSQDLIMQTAQQYLEQMKFNHQVAFDATAQGLQQAQFGLQQSEFNWTQQTTGQFQPWPVNGKMGWFNPTTRQLLTNEQMMSGQYTAGNQTYNGGLQGGNINYSQQTGGVVPSTPVVSSDIGGKQVQGQQIFLDALQKADAAYYADTGQHMSFNESYRSPAAQAAAYKKYQNGTGGRAAPPGQSFHQKGLAVDISGANINAYKPYLAQVGIVNGLSGDMGHFSMGELNPNIFKNQQQPQQTYGPQMPEQSTMQVDQNYLQNYNSQVNKSNEITTIPNGYAQGQDAYGFQGLTYKDLASAQAAQQKAFPDGAPQSQAQGTQQTQTNDFAGTSIENDPNLQPSLKNIAENAWATGVMPTQFPAWMPLGAQDVKQYLLNKYGTSAPIDPSQKTSLAGLQKEFATEESVKNYKVLKSAYNQSQNLGNTPTDQKQLLTDLANASNPAVPVTTRDYGIFAKDVQSLVDQYGVDVARVFTNAAILTPDAVKGVKDTIAKLYQERLDEYNQTYQDYVGQVQNYAPQIQDPSKWLIDYSKSTTKNNKTSTSNYPINQSDLDLWNSLK